MLRCSVVGACREIATERTAYAVAPQSSFCLNVALCRMSAALSRYPYAYANNARNRPAVHVIRMYAASWCRQTLSTVKYAMWVSRRMCGYYGGRRSEKIVAELVERVE